jgi:hypothetical protein
MSSTFSTDTDNGFDTSKAKRNFVTVESILQQESTILGIKFTDCVLPLTAIGEDRKLLAVESPAYQDRFLQVIRTNAGRIAETKPISTHKVRDQLRRPLALEERVSIFFLGFNL